MVVGATRLSDELEFIDTGDVNFHRLARVYLQRRRTKELPAIAAHDEDSRALGLRAVPQAHRGREKVPLAFKREGVAGRRMRIEPFGVQPTVNEQDDTLMALLIEPGMIPRRLSPTDLRAGPFNVGEKNTASSAIRSDRLNFGQRRARRVVFSLRDIERGKRDTSAIRIQLLDCGGLSGCLLRAAANNAHRAVKREQAVPRIEIMRVEFDGTFERMQALPRQTQCAEDGGLWAACPYASPRR